LSKPLLGLVIGAVLGLIDGLSALLYPGTASMIVPIVIGSTIKGLVTGTAMGLRARRFRSVTVGILGGLALGLALSYLAALTPDPQGGHHFLEIMVPGAILGIIVGFATQRFGPPATRGRAQGSAHP
jgi:peptidoglycan/LPS O-acetylase OafA/YrhL